MKRSVFMSAEELRTEIAEALKVMWGSFAERHPRVASYMDRTKVLDGVTEFVEEDGQCQHGLADAAALGKGPEEMSRLVRGFVKGWLEGLV